MLSACNVSFAYAGSQAVVISDLSVQLPLGSMSFVWGDNGAGKSTFAQIMCGLIPHVVSGQFSGEVEYLGCQLLAPYKSGLATYLMQNPSLYFHAATLREELSLLENHRHALYDEAIDMLPHRKWNEPVRTLSLGEQKLVAVVLVLMHRCPIVVLDEPLAFLDGKASQFASHLLSTAANEDRIILAVDTPEHGLEMGSVGRYFLVADSHVVEAKPQIQPREQLITSGPTGTEFLKAEGIGFSYRGKEAFHLAGINLTVAEGESVGLTGHNGAGKSTLQLVLSGLLRPSNGHVYIKGVQQGICGLRKRVKCSFQNPDDQLFGNTIMEELVFGLRNLNLPSSQIHSRIKEVEHYLNCGLAEDPFILSYGQRKFLTLLSAYLLDPDVLILDEPTAGLDYSNRQKLYDLLLRFLKQGKSLIIISHDRSEIEMVCHRTYEMKDGMIVAESRNYWGGH